VLRRANAAAFSHARGFALAIARTIWLNYRRPCRQRPVNASTEPADVSRNRSTAAPIQAGTFPSTAALGLGKGILPGLLPGLLLLTGP
jgi:hypothetical protein